MLMQEDGAGGSALGASKILQLGSGGPSPQKRSKICQRGTNQARHNMYLASKII